MVRLPTLALMSFVLCSACRSATIAEGVSDSTFAAVMGDLKRIPISRGPDSIRTKASRDSVLKHYGIDSATLERVAAELANDPDRTQKLWEAIQRRAEAGKSAP